MLLNSLPLGGVISFNRNDGKFKFDYANFTNNIFVYLYPGHVYWRYRHCIKFVRVGIDRTHKTSKYHEEIGRRRKEGG
jgi:hypothetical protein